MPSKHQMEACVLQHVIVLETVSSARQNLCHDVGSPSPPCIPLRGVMSSVNKCGPLTLMFIELRLLHIFCIDIHAGERAAARAGRLA